MALSTPYKFTCCTHHNFVPHQQYLSFALLIKYEDGGAGQTFLQWRCVVTTPMLQLFKTFSNLQQARSRPFQAHTSKPETCEHFYQLVNCRTHSKLFTIEWMHLFWCMCTHAFVWVCVRVCVSMFPTDTHHYLTQHFMKYQTAKLS